jgi:hypothetical protein
LACKDVDYKGEDSKCKGNKNMDSIQVVHRASRPGRFPILLLQGDRSLPNYILTGSKPPLYGDKCFT